MTVAFNRPTEIGTEVDYIRQAMTELRWAGAGKFTTAVQELLEQAVGVRKALLTTSCTTALEMAALLLEIEPGDEVIVPSFSFVSTANAFALRGAKPVFADIRPDTLNIDEEKIEQLITPRTKAIVVVHYAGVGSAMDCILAHARRHNLAVIEDNAHGLFARYRGQPLGSFGCMATQSFHETKNFTCGEGGALLINVDDLIARAEIVWEKGTNRLHFLRGQVEKYTWVDFGSSCLPADLLAALLLAQLRARELVQSERQRVWHYYQTNLSRWAGENGVRLPVIPAECEQPYHLFYLILPSAEIRGRLIDYLAKYNIQSAFHYVPLHLSKMGERFGGGPGQCPVCEDLSERLLRLPFHTGLTESEQEYVVTTLTAFRPR